MISRCPFQPQPFYDPVTPRAARRPNSHQVLTAEASLSIYNTANAQQTPHHAVHGQADFAVQLIRKMSPA